MGQDREVKIIAEALAAITQEVHISIDKEPGIHPAKVKVEGNEIAVTGCILDCLIHHIEKVAVTNQKMATAMVETSHEIIDNYLRQLKGDF